MTATTTIKTSIPNNLASTVLSRILEEGYGPGAWHGPDLKAALADVTPEVAFWRPAPGRHNIAEIALHHAYCIRAVRGQVQSTAPEPFVLQGEDWFTLSDESTLTWSQILATVESEQSRLGATIAKTSGDHFDLALGITCHAVYHAGQIQLIKRLRETVETGGTSG